MNTFTVDTVIDGDTFSVKNGWKWNNQSGNIVRPTGYDTPEKGEPGYNEATKKLTDLILNKQVELGKVVNMDHGRIVCDVFFNGQNLADYFPEYKS